MPKPDNAVRLTDRYNLKDLEPDVDPEKAAAYLAAGEKAQPRSATPGVKPTPQPKPKTNNKKPAAVAATNGQAVGEGTLPDKQAAKAEVWTSRTIRLRQSTANALTKAACGQKTKQVEGKLKLGEATTVQEIAERGIRLALIELGYLKK